VGTLQDSNSWIEYSNARHAQQHFFTVNRFFETPCKILSGAVISPVGALRGREPSEGEKIELRINDEPVRGKVTEARKDVAGPGADAFTVMVDETC
jgi:hypothetical protein